MTSTSHSRNVQTRFPGKFSENTRHLINSLMQEASLTKIQREKINRYLLNESPFPNLSHPKLPPKRSRPVSCPNPARRRTLGAILGSGAYDMEPLVRRMDNVDREECVRMLQKYMEFGREAVVKEGLGRMLKVRKMVDETCETPVLDRYDELKAEIREREEWLEEMEALGAAGPYRQMIWSQINTKLRQIQQLPVDGPKSSVE